MGYNGEVALDAAIDDLAMMSAQFNTAQTENQMLWSEIRFLKEALKQAGDFAEKRIPKDARELTGADSGYYQNIWCECAKATIESERANVESTVATADTAA